MKRCVVYFSASGTTKILAEKLSKVINADLFEIIPKQPYTEDDLNWMDKNSRSSREMSDKNSRPEIENTINIKDYDEIYLGFPIWWYTAPTIIKTFLCSQDFSNKIIYIFATSGGSGLGKTDKDLAQCVDKSSKIVAMKVFESSISGQSLKNEIEKYKI